MSVKKRTQIQKFFAWNRPIARKCREYIKGISGLFHGAKMLAFSRPLLTAGIVPILLLVFEPTKSWILDGFAIGIGTLSPSASPAATMSRLLLISIFLMFYTYILKSSKSNRYYIGSTENMNKRIKEHNRGMMKSTKHDLPWELFYFEKYNSRSEAVAREKQIKSWKSRAMIEKLRLT